MEKTDPYNHLRKYILFLLNNHLDSFVKENIRLAKEFDLPANKVIFNWKEEESFKFIQSRTEIFLGFFKEENPLLPAILELNKWKDDTMPQVNGRILNIEDLTGSYDIRKMILTSFLHLYTKDISEIQKIILQFEHFNYYWKKEALRILFELENIRLLAEIEKRTEELSTANASLKKINSDLDNFIYTASHDLKAPVSNIEGLVHTLHEELKDKGKIDKDVDQIIELVNESVKRFQTTIQDLTEISKIQKDLYEDVIELDVEEMIEEAKLMVNSLILENKAEIKITSIDPKKLRFSRINFRSILYNLLSNAIKYKLEDNPPVIHISFLADDEKYDVLSVSDNGLGIKEEYIPKIFQMFKRVHSHVEGTGIGLYLVKRITENAGGKIVVESRENEGSVFKIYFKR